MAKELHITMYDHIGSEGITAKSIQEQLAANPNASEIVLHINSLGGNVYEGYTIYNLLKNSGKKITAKIEGVCASIATLIALSAEEIVMLPLSQWLIHNPYAPAEGDAEVHEKAAVELRRIENTIAELYANKTGKSIEEMKALMIEDKFIGASEAVEIGFVTRVSEPLKAVAYYSHPKTNPNNMSNTEKPSKWKQLATFIANLGGDEDGSGPASSSESSEVVAATTTLENGETIYHEGELSEGTAVFSDAEMTSALADGEYVLTDGRICTVSGGIVSTIAEAAPANAVNEELVQANAEIERLKGELAAVANAKDTTIKNLRGELATAKKKTPAQNHAGDESKIEAKSGQGPKLREGSIAANAARFAR